MRDAQKTLEEKTISCFSNTCGMSLTDGRVSVCFSGQVFLDDRRKLWKSCISVWTDTAGPESYPQAFRALLVEPGKGHKKKKRCVYLRLSRRSTAIKSFEHTTWLGVCVLVQLTN